jgi:hypothetical protein
MLGNQLIMGADATTRVYDAGPDGIFFNQDDPPVRTHGSLYLVLGAFSGGNNVLVFPTSGATNPPAVLRTNGTESLADVVPLNLDTPALCPTPLGKGEGAINASHVFWVGANGSVCWRDGGASLFTGPTKRLAPLSGGAIVGVQKVFMIGEHEVLLADGGGVTRRSAGPDGQFGTADDTSISGGFGGTVLDVDAANGHHAVLTSDPAGYHVLRDFVEVATPSSVPIGLTIRPDGRLVWSDTTFPHRTLFTFIP